MVVLRNPCSIEVTNKWNNAEEHWKMSHIYTLLVNVLYSKSFTYYMSHAEAST